MESSQNLIFSKRKRKMGSFSQPYGGGRGCQFSGNLKESGCIFNLKGSILLRLLIFGLKQKVLMLGCH